MLQLNFNAYTIKVKSNFGIKKRNNKMYYEIGK